MIKGSTKFKNKERLNLQMNRELKTWCENKADELGLSMNGFINMVLSNLKKTDE